MLNKLCLGTVQMGLQYGINNTLGRKPTRQEIFGILERALANGVETFDTAAAYGDAERILGEFGIARYHAKIISKIGFNAADHLLTPDTVTQAIMKVLARMKIESIYGILLHHVEDYNNFAVMEGLFKAKEAGLCQCIGVSIYEEQDALRIVHDAKVDIIQIPYNVFDRRLDHTNFFEETKLCGIKVYARSPFLQGLLLMEPQIVPDYLNKACPELIKFREICADFGYSPYEAAFLYSYCNRDIDKVVFGVDTLEQLENNLSVVRKCQGFGACYNVLRSNFLHVDRTIVLPSLWQTISK